LGALGWLVAVLHQPASGEPVNLLRRLTGIRAGRERIDGEPRSANGASSFHLVWEAENRQVLAAWREKEGTEAVKEALPLELHSYADHLLSRRLPSFDLKEAREALHDCQRRLERRLLEAEKLAMSALLATEEEELGPAVLAEAAVSAEVVADERIVEAVSLQLRDMETGLRLHAQGRSNPTERVETGTDG